MRKEDFEALIIDYVEGALPEDTSILFEQTKKSSEDFEKVFSEYQFITRIAEALREEQYQASPGFRYRVMERIEKEAYSPLARYLEFFTLNRPLFAGIATALIFILAIYIPKHQYKELSQTPFETAKDIVSLDEELSIEYPEIKRKHSPLVITRFASTGERIDITPGAQSERISPIENLLNVIGTTFPVGDQIPLAVSAEAIVSPRDSSQIIFRSSLSAIPQEGSDGEIAKDIRVNYILSDQNISGIEPLGNPSAQESVSSGSLLWAKGETMIADQQFTSIALITLKDATLNSFPLVKVVVSYVDAHTDEQKNVMIDFSSSKIEKQFSKASPGLQQAFWMSYKDRFSPGIYSKITPEAYKNLHGMVEGMMKDLMDPNPESLERFEKKLEALRPTPRPLRLPPGIKDKLTKEQLKTLYPNWVEDDGTKP